METVPILTPDRAMYEWLKTKSKYAGRTITQGFLRLIQPLGTSNTITWPFLADSKTAGASAQFDGEFRLQRSDSFWATQFGFFIDKATTNLADSDGTDLMVGQTFPNPQVFLTAAAIAPLESLYNAKAKIENASDLYFQNLDVKRFRFAGVAQQGLEVSAGIVQNAYATSEYNPRTGFYEAVPHMDISGKSTPSMIVTLSANQDMSSTESDIEYYGIWYFRGFYIPDGANLGK